MANKILNVDTVARGLINRMRPHIAHQSQWANNGVGLRCNWCKTDFLAVADFGQVRYLTVPQQHLVRETVARWIFTNSDQEAKLTFKM